MVTQDEISGLVDIGYIPTNSAGTGLEATLGAPSPDLQEAYLRKSLLGEEGVDQPVPQDDPLGLNLRSGNITVDPIQQHQAVIQQVQNSIETTLGKKSADLTIGCGLKGESLAQAGQNTKADIISGKKAPGFFEGIAGFVGDFARSEAGTTLLSGIAGQAVGREFGVSDTAGFLQGASGGQAQIKQQKATAVAADKLKEDQRVQNEKLKIARDANNISRGKAKAVANKPKGKRYPTDMQKSGQTLFQRVNLLSPEEAKIGKNALAKRPEFMALEPWEKSLLTEVMDDKINGGSLAQILATVATARD